MSQFIERNSGGGKGGEIRSTACSFIDGSFSVSLLDKEGEYHKFTNERGDDNGRKRDYKPVNIFALTPWWKITKLA